MEAVGECLELRDNTAAAQGGGLYFATQVNLRSGAVTIEGNHAKEGGGVCGNGWGAEVSIGGDSRLMVTKNEAAVDGGGLALTALARVTIDRGECPSSCAAAYANGICDWDCLLPGCNFDGGDCNSLFTEAGPGALEPCDRDKCKFANEAHGSICYVDCLNSACDWSESNPICSPYMDQVAACPLLEARSYLSYADTPALTFVGEAGTAAGHGRCSTECATTPTPEMPDWCPTCTAPEAGASWCEVIDDSGQKYLPDCPTCDVAWYLPAGQSWGECSDVPRLPVSAFDYQPASMQDLVSLTPHELFTAHPGCGKTPLVVEGNKAGRNGGGLFKESCNIVAHRKEECFVEGTGGSTFIPFSDNTAGAAGGGVYVGCHTTGSCDGTLALPFDTSRRSGGEYSKLSFTGNSASTFGDDVGANALHLLVEHREPTAIPGQSSLDFSLALTDGLGQRMQSPTAAPLPLLVAVMVCPDTPEPCTSLNVLQPQSYMEMAAGDDFVHTTAQGATLDRCQVGQTSVRVDLAVIGSVSDIPSLRLSTNVSCEPCQEGQALTHEDGTWTCKSCSPIQYIVNPNDPDVPCQNCPVGAKCDGRHLEGMTPDEVWTVDEEAGLMVLTECPPGHRLVRSIDGIDGPFAHDAQMCAACQVNQYIANQNSECLNCPLGAECDGRSVHGKVEGSVWMKENDTVRLQECPAGCVIVRDDELHSLDQCVMCPRGKYSLLRAVLADPGPGEAILRVSDPVEAAAGTLCYACEDGAECDGGSSVVPNVGWWRRDVELVNGTDKAELYRCPPSACSEGGVCASGRTGPVCGLCNSGWSMGNGMCTRCTYGLETFGVIFYIVLAIVGCCVYFVVSLQPLLMKDKSAVLPDEQHNICWRGWATVQHIWGQLHGAEGSARLLLGYFKVMVSFFQMLSSFLYTFSVEWSPSISRLMEVSGFFSFQLFAFPGPSCLANHIGHEGRLVLYTVVPLAVILLLIAPGGIALMVSGKSMDADRKRRIIQTMVRPVQVWLFLTYPLLTYQTLSNFHCQHLSPDGEGEYLLISNYRIECPLREPGGFLFLWSLFFGVLYSAGIPLLFFVVLRVYEVPNIGSGKRLDEVTEELIAIFQKRHARDVEALTWLCSRLLHTQPGAQASFDLPTVRACCPALYQDVLRELGGEIDRHGLTAWLKRNKALCVRTQLLRALVNAHAKQGLLDEEGFTEVICRMVQENVLFEGQERFSQLSDDQLKRLLACKWHASLSHASPSQDKTKLVRSLATQPSFKRSKTNLSPAPAPRTERALSHADSVFDMDIDETVERPGARGSMEHSSTDLLHSDTHGSEWVPLPHGSKSIKEKKRDMEDGVRGSLWAFEGVKREMLEQRFVEMVKKLELIGVLSRENTAWGGSGPKEQLALDHLGFLFKGYRVGVWYWEVVELLRKLTFNALMVFIFPGSRAQLICGFLIAAVFMLASAKFSPHKDKRVATLHFVASIALCVTLLYAICVRLLENGPEATGESGLREFLSWLAVILICSVFAFPLVMYVFNTDLNPFILWSRAFTRRRHDEADPDTTPRASRYTIQTDAASPMSPVRRSLLPRSPDAMHHDNARTSISTLGDQPATAEAQVVVTGEQAGTPPAQEDQGAGLGDDVTMTPPAPQPAVITMEPTPRGYLYTPRDEPFPSGFTTAREIGEA